MISMIEDGKLNRDHAQNRERSAGHGQLPQSTAAATAIESIDELRYPQSALLVQKTTSDSPGSLCSRLPDSLRQLVESACAIDRYELFSEAVSKIVKIGGIDAAKALALIIAQTAQDNITYHSTGGRHVTIYTLCNAMLRLTGAKRLDDLMSIDPQKKLTRDESKQVRQFVRFLAVGDHGDIETAMGARSVFFVRAASLPLVGGVIEGLLNISAGLGKVAHEGGPPTLLFKLIDLPWKIYSKIPSASQDSRKNNFADIMHGQSL